ncbi:hypothetical protein SEA_FORREST_9 [Streptomyces phage Forrest]|nr:hypothetical protein SEA_FORREST_9 [Streptomyces phage Forrest]
MPIEVLSTKTEASGDVSLRLIDGVTTVNDLRKFLRVVDAYREHTRGENGYFKFDIDTTDATTPVLKVEFDGRVSTVVKKEDS